MSKFYHNITHSKPLFWGKGHDVQVELEFSEYHRKLIRDNNLGTVVIVPGEKSHEYITDGNGKRTKVEKDNNLYFKDFYDHRSSWHVDSELEGKQLHAQIYEGLLHLQDLLDANAVPAETTEGIVGVKDPKPFDIGIIPDYVWEQHAYILAESGGGKTQLLQTIVAQHLAKPKPQGLIIIDSQDKMLPLIKERFPAAIVIDPFDNPPSLDLFNPGTFYNADAGVQSIGIHSLLETFRYLFETGEEPITGRQGTAFTYAISLMLMGYPAAFGETATIEDLEDYLTGEKRGAELSARAHEAANAMPEDFKKWYYSQYGRYAESNSQILQRLSNICGPVAPLRPLFKKHGDPLNLKDKLEYPNVFLINTHRHKLGKYASSFFGRFFFKLLDKNIGGRDEKSHPYTFITDEVHEYFDATVITPFIDQARKRNIFCIFAHQRLAQLNGQELLRDALTGVGVTMATNINKNDIRYISTHFGVEPELVQTWRLEQTTGATRPRYADFGMVFKGKTADAFRLQFGQLEALTVKEKRKAQEQPRQEQQHEGPTGPPKDDEYDERYDAFEKITLNPIKAKRGYVHTVKFRGSEHLLPIPPNTHDTAHFCIKGANPIRRPDNRNGNLWVEVHVPPFEHAKEDF